MAAMICKRPPQSGHSSTSMANTRVSKQAQLMRAGAKESEVWRGDRMHLEYPFLGSRKLTRLLKDEGHAIGRRHVVTLMRCMGIKAISRKPRTDRLGETMLCAVCAIAHITSCSILREFHQL